MSRGVNFTEYVGGLTYGRLFSNSGWPEWLGGILLGLANIVFLALAEKPFTIYGGFYEWGASVYSQLGLDLEHSSIFTNKTSVGDLGLLTGAFIAALLANEFKARRPVGGIEYLEGALGGFLMAVGVALAWGCNWGGFFSAVTALSLHGFAMLPGLVLGGYLGLRYVRWKMEKMASVIEVELEEAPGGAMVKASSTARPNAWARLLVAALALALLLSVVNYFGNGFFAALAMVGVLVGLVIQRSRFCFATAFRDLLGGPEMVRSVRLQVGIALGIIVGATGAAALKYMGYVDPGVYVKYVSLSNFLGGVIFAFGMSLAGACASGSLWRVAEGHIKALIALVAAVASYPLLVSPVREVVVGSLAPVKVPLFALGWAVGLALVYASMVAWILFVYFLAYRRGVMVHG
ncbi:MAG: YeeE/YedE family protein [Desulfurococcales archaeon]|nr:YeeE/YedE family protein [Desulfurococcales archaeon]